MTTGEVCFQNDRMNRGCEAEVGFGGCQSDLERGSAAGWIWSS